MADDNVEVAETLAEILRMAGHRVRVALDGEAALQSASGQVPDVALLDIGMPGRNGYDVARVLREGVDTRGIYLVAVTGWGQPADKAQAAAAGFDMHLVKPLQPDGLLELLATMPVRASRPATTA